MPTAVSIPAWFDWRRHLGRPPACRVSGFNTSLVRLAPPTTRTVSLTGACFNTSLVRLALVVARDGGSVDARFNTSLVRLAPLPPPPSPPPPPRFNTSLVRLAPPPALHHWPFGGTFQYQLGSIGANIAICYRVFASPVSIPAWFDWRTAWCSGGGMVRPGFNTTLVRLAPRRRAGVAGYILSFQYQLGSIGAPCSRTF